MPGYLGNLSVSVGDWRWLLLIPLILPPLIWASLKSLSGLGHARRLIAILFRTAVVTLIVLALAQVQAVRRNEKLTTIFLIDRSASVPRDWENTLREYVNGSIRNHKRSGDLAGVIVFGRSPKVESPPTPFPNELLGIENVVDAEFTDLASAIKLALATFPEDTARRIVILSDGNENRGNSIEQAMAAKSLGVQIDVLPVLYRYDREVLVEKISLPPDVKKGETVNINVVIRASEPTSGTLQIFQTTDNHRTGAAGNEQPLAVSLQRGVNVFTLKQTITQPNFYTFTAEFIPEKDSGDRRTINNIAESFTHVRGIAQVLLIEGNPGPGKPSEHAELVQALRAKGLEVKVLVAPGVDGSGSVGGDSLPTDMAQLQPYDTIILGNVPKDSFTDRQIQLLESNVHDSGAGLIMLGGKDSFGAGRWMNTPVEKALPVNMEIPALKVQGKSATVMIMHATEIPEGNFWMKEIARESIKTLSAYDYVGLLYWNGQESWLFTVRSIGENRGNMLRAIDRMAPSDMLDFGPSVQMAMKGLLKDAPDALTRHIIVISDGDPAEPSNAIVKQLVSNRITVTTVLTAAHGNDLVSLNRMKRLATQTKGRFYNVTNPRALPRIYQQEARLVSRPLIFERQVPWIPVIDKDQPSEALINVNGNLPAISGLVLTSPKENFLVGIPVKSPLPTGQVNPVLAHWQYGLGRAVAYTPDAGRKWAKDWPNWESYASFWSQVVRWSMRPVDRGNYTLTVRQEEGQIKVVVDALDKNNQFQNFARINGNVVSPDLKGEPIELSQVSSGRYEATIPNADARGNYLVTLGYTTPEGERGQLSTAVSVPYSDEYRELQSNPATLQNLASLTGGATIDWKFRRSGNVDVAQTIDAEDVFRRDAAMKPPSGFQDLWPTLLWLAAVLFLGDVAVRRVSPDFERMRRAVSDQWKKLRGRDVAPPADYMEKLKSRKAEVAEQIDRSRSATRYEAPPIPTAAGPVGEPLLEGGPATTDASRNPARGAGPGSPSLAPTGPKVEAESYTNRLLKAKQKVWEDREKDKNEK